MTESRESSQRYRTHLCGSLRAGDIGKTVKLSGWVATRRDHGGVIFIDLRDRDGLTQVVFDPKYEGGSRAHDIAGAIRSEFVIHCTGKVRSRPDGMKNPNMVTGEIEVICDDLEILSTAKTPPFEIDDSIEVSETLRLKYRYLDLRRPRLQKNLRVRSQALHAVRAYLVENEFLEIETPILYKSTPEGARDFIVPSRLHPGNFYALPQSPQTLKQLLMIGGMDRYFQVARCFRDEDLRADRQPEFTQVDIETSFLSQEEFFEVMEGMVARVWKDVLGEEVKLPLARMSYKDAMTQYGSDKPDTRFELKLQELTDLFSKSDFKVLSSARSIRCLSVPGEAAKFSRKDLDDLTDEAKRYGAKGLLWIKVQEGGEWQSPAAKFLSEEEKKSVSERLGLKSGHLILIVADQKDRTVCQSLGAIRLKVGQKLGLIPSLAESPPHFLWVTHFPLLDYDEKDGRYYALHHPFTNPADEDVETFLEGKNLENISSGAYDLVLNGAEIGGGSQRIYRQDVQEAMFRNLGMSSEEAKERFGFFLEALQFGTPPHCGIALGVERLVAMLCKVGPIRDVMAFPKTQKGQCLMSNSPSKVEAEQLTESGISLRKSGQRN